MIIYKFYRPAAKKMTAILIAVCLMCLGAGDRKSASAGTGPERPSVYVPGPGQISTAPFGITLAALLARQQTRWEERSASLLSQKNKNSLNTSASAQRPNPLPALSLMLEDAYRSLNN